MKASINTITGLMIESSSSSFPETLIANAVAMGIPAGNVSVVEVSNAEHLALIKARDTASISFDDHKTNTCALIDTDTDAIYGAVLGNRGPEYLDAEVAAQAYKDAGYTGTVPEDVQSYATAMGWTAQQAADDILATAAAWRPAKHAIRANRLAAKEAVRDSLTISEVEAVLAWWAIFVVTIRSQLGI